MKSNNGFLPAPGARTNVKPPKSHPPTKKPPKRRKRTEADSPADKK